MGVELDRLAVLEDYYDIRNAEILFPLPRTITDIRTGEHLSPLLSLYHVDKQGNELPHQSLMNQVRH